MEFDKNSKNNNNEHGTDNLGSESVLEHHTLDAKTDTENVDFDTMFDEEEIISWAVRE